MTDIFHQMWAAQEHYPWGANGWLALGFLLSWLAVKIDALVRPRLECRDNERREREIRQDEIDYRGWKLSTVGNEEAQRLQAMWDRDDRMAALLQERHAIKAALEQEAGRRPRNQAVISALFDRERKVEEKINRELDREAAAAS
jgi:hypothetical protein